MEKSKIEEAISHLQSYVEQIDKGLNYRDKNAISTAIWALKTLKHRNEDDVDFQGWPLVNQSYGELVERLGCYAHREGVDDLKDYKVRLMIDDGMGYGATNGYCTAVEIDKENKDIRFWS